MKTSNKERTLQWINNQHKKGSISFEHKLQRPIGQWNGKMKSLLIHSLLSGMPVNPIYVIDEDGTLYTLDGSQRTSTCIAYINNEFALSKGTPNIVLTIKENGQPVSKEYVIEGKRFKKLDDEVKDTLLACSLEFCTLSEYTDDEVKEMFKRQNSSKPVNKKQLRIVIESDDFSDKIFTLSKNPFIKKLMTNAQCKNGTDKDIIIQTLMLIESTNGNEYLSFRGNDIDSFVLDHSDKVSDIVFDTLTEALNSMDGAFDEIKIPVTSIPMVLYCGYQVKKNKKSFSKFVDVVNNFLATYDKNDEYRQFVTSGTSGIENVKGRFEYWKNLIKTI